ncbi:MAG: hypothetical protein ABR529_01265 [Actinomycetota bacterium]
MTSDPDGVAAFDAPLTFTATIREALTMYRRKPLALIAPFAVFYLLVTTLVVGARGAQDLAGAGRVALVLAFQLGVPVLGTIATALSIVVMHDASLGRPTGVGTAARALRPMAKEVLAAALLAAILAFLIFIPPLSVLVIFIGSTGLSAVLFGPPIVIHAVVLERKTLARAWPRTRALMSGNWARLLLHWLTIALVVTVIAGLLSLPGRINALASVIVNGIVLGAFVPFIAAFVLVTYLDVRTGLDSTGAREAPA